MWFLPLRNSLIVCSPIHTHFGRFDFHVQLSPWRISLLWLLVRFRFFGRFCVCALVWLVKFLSEKWQKFIKWKIPSALRSFEMEYCLCFILFIWVNNFFYEYSKRDSVTEISFKMFTTEWIITWSLLIEKTIESLKQLLKNGMQNWITHGFSTKINEKCISFTWKNINDTQKYIPLFRRCQSS